MLITKLTCFVVSYKLQTQEFGSALKACFSRFKDLHALKLSFLSPASDCYTSRPRQKQSWKTSEDVQYTSSDSLRTVGKTTPARKAESAGVFPYRWEVFRLSDAGSQFMVWVSGSGSLMREYEVDNRANRNSRSSTAAQKQSRGSRVQPRATANWRWWFLSQIRATDFTN